MTRLICIALLLLPAVAVGQNVIIEVGETINVSAVSDFTPCDDGTFCNGVEVCKDGVTYTPTTGPCPTGKHCNEELDLCVECLVNTDCDDGLFCNGSESCVGSQQCLAGSPPCPPGVVCDETNDQCPVCTTDAECSDGSFCNGTEQCVSSSCTSGTPPNCSGGTPYCSENDDACTECLTDEHCDDGLFCNGVEQCIGSPFNCTTGTNPCVAGQNCDESSDSCSDPPASPCTIYVDVSNTGAEDGSQSNPWNTIQEGVDDSNAVAGATICVAPGTYVANPNFQVSHVVELTTSGAVGNPISIVAQEANNRPIIDGQLTNDDAFICQGCQHWVIDGFEIIQARQRGLNIDDGVTVTARNILARDNASTISGQGSRKPGVQVTGASRTVVLENIVVYNCGAGIKILGASGDAVNRPIGVTVNTAYLHHNNYTEEHSDNLQVIVADNVTINDVVAHDAGDDNFDVTWDSNTVAFNRCIGWDVPFVDGGQGDGANFKMGAGPDGQFAIGITLTECVGFNSKFGVIGHGRNVVVDNCLFFDNTNAGTIADCNGNNANMTITDTASFGNGPDNTYRTADTNNYNTCNHNCWGDSTNCNDDADESGHDANSIQGCVPLLTNQAVPGCVTDIASVNFGSCPGLVPATGSPLINADSAGGNIGPF